MHNFYKIDDICYVITSFIDHISGSQLEICKPAITAFKMNPSIIIGLERESIIFSIYVYM